MSTRLTWLLLLPLGLALGCNGDDNDPDTDPPFGDDDDLPGDDDDDLPGDDDDDDGILDEARIRVLHLADTLGPVDLYVERTDATDDGTDLDERAGDEVIVVEGLAVDEASDYLTVAAGTREIELYGAGTDALALEIDVDLMADTDHTLVVWGDPAALEWLVIEDDPSTVPADAAGVEFLNLDTGEVTVYDATPAAEPPPLVLLAQIPPEGVDVPAGSHTRLDVEPEVTALGIDLDGDAVIDLEVPLPETLAMGALYHLALHLDETGEPSVTLLDREGRTDPLPAEPPPADQAQLRLANLVPDLGTGDVYVERVEGEEVPLIDRPVDEVLLFADPAYASASAFFGVDAGVRDVEFYADAAATPFASTDVTLATDVAYTVFAYGSAGALDALAVEEDDDGLAAGQAALLFTHLDPNFGTIDLLDLTDPGAPVLLVDDLAFESTARVDVDPAIDGVGIDVDEDGVADFTIVLDPITAPIAADEAMHVALHANGVGSDVALLLAPDGEWAVTAVLPAGGP